MRVIDFLVQVVMSVAAMVTEIQNLASATTRQENASAWTTHLAFIVQNVWMVTMATHSKFQHFNTVLCNKKTCLFDYFFKLLLLLGLANQSHNANL